MFDYITRFQSVQLQINYELKFVEIVHHLDVTSCCSVYVKQTGVRTPRALHQGGNMGGGRGDGRCHASSLLHSLFVLYRWGRGGGCLGECVVASAVGTMGGGAQTMIHARLL